MLPDPEHGRVLFFAPGISKSIKFKAMPIVTGLADKGHEVVLVMPYCEECGKHANITVVDVEKPNGKNYEELLILSKLIYLVFTHFAEELIDKYRTVLLDPDVTLYEYFVLCVSMFDGLLGSINKAMKHPDLHSQLDLGFDAVINYNTLGGPEDMVNYLAEKVNAPLVYFATAHGPTSRLSYLIGQPFHPAYMLQPGVVTLDQLSFIDRVINTLTIMFNEAFRWRTIFRLNCALYLTHTSCFTIFRISATAKLERLLDEHFPGEIRTPLPKLSDEAHLMLHTGHPLLDGVRPVVPNYQHIGFIHCRPAQPLSHEFEDFMKKNIKNGVILVSFGTFAQGVPDSVRSMMMDVFSKLEQGVIWKWDGPPMHNMPENIMLTKWVPQQDILGHPATKLFISHVGQSSVQEAIYHGKPVVKDI